MNGQHQRLWKWCGLIRCNYQPPVICNIDSNLLLYILITQGDWRRRKRRRGRGRGMGKGKAWGRGWQEDRPHTVQLRQILWGCDSGIIVFSGLSKWVSCAPRPENISMCSYQHSLNEATQCPKGPSSNSFANLYLGHTSIGPEVGVMKSDKIQHKIYLQRHFRHKGITLRNKTLLMAFKSCFVFDDKKNESFRIESNFRYYLEATSNPNFFF